MTRLVLFAATALVALADPKRIELSDDDIADIVVGVAEGFFVGDENVADLKPCVKTFDKMKDDVIAAVTLIENQTSADMVKGFTKLADALDAVPEALQRCNVDHDEVQKVIDAIEQIKDIKSFAYEIGKHLMINGVDILHEIADAVGAFGEKKYETFGVKIGDALRKVLLGAKPLQALNLSKGDIGHLILGITEGFFMGDKVNVTLPCIHAGGDLEQDIIRVVDLIERQTADSVLRGIKLLSRALRVVPDALEKCNATREQVEKAIEALRTLNSATKFAFTAGKNLLINGAEIYQEIISAVGYWHVRNYAHFGIEIGLMLRKVLVGDHGKKPGKVKFDDKDAIDVVLGIAQGLFFGSPSEVTDKCVTDAKVLLLDANEAVTLFKKETAADIRQGLIVLANSLKIVDDAFIQCKAQVAHIEKIAMAIAAISHPTQFAFKIGEHLLVNGVDIYHKLLAAINDWDDQDYEAFGVQVGLILSDILVEIKPPNTEMTSHVEMEIIA